MLRKVSVPEVALVPLLLLYFIFRLLFIYFEFFLVFYFLSFVEFQLALFLIFLGKFQPDVSYKGCSYKKASIDTSQSINFLEETNFSLLGYILPHFSAIT